MKNNVSVKISLNFWWGICLFLVVTHCFLWKLDPALISASMWLADFFFYSLKILVCTARWSKIGNNAISQYKIKLNIRHSCLPKPVSPINSLRFSQSSNLLPYYCSFESIQTQLILPYIFPHLYAHTFSYLSSPAEDLLWSTKDIFCGSPLGAPYSILTVISEIFFFSSIEGVPSSDLIPPWYQ